MNNRPAKQNIHGVILLDKPSGMSSNQALQKVKWLFNAKKAGHTGSLDPLATGLLPLCFGQATKVSEYLLGSDKKYTAIIKLGETTDTLDSDGQVLERKPVNVSDGDIEQALIQFRGAIKQVPPMFSALKKDGKPLYKLARTGEVVDRPARAMTVHSLSATRLDNVQVALQVHCSSGFYIRSLAHDLGQALHCGAHVIELRRTDIRSISVEQAVGLTELESFSLESGKTAPSRLQSVLQPIECLLSDMPQVTLSDHQVMSLEHGKKTPAEGIETTKLSRFYTADKRLFAVGEVTAQGYLKTHKKFIETT